MEITPTEIYWLLKLDDIQTFFFGIATILTVFTAIYAIVNGINIDDSYSSEDKKPLWKEFWKKLSVFSGAATILFLVGTFLPSTKQMSAIYILPPVINNEKVQEIPSELMDLLGLSLDKAKELLEPKK